MGLVGHSDSTKQICSVSPSSQARLLWPPGSNTVLLLHAEPLSAAAQGSFLLSEGENCWT